MQTARHWAPRSYAFVILLHLTGARSDELLALNADQLGYGRGHRPLPLTEKGGTQRPTPVPPVALKAPLGDGADGPLFVTDSGVCR